MNTHTPFIALAALAAPLCAQQPAPMPPTAPPPALDGQGAIAPTMEEKTSPEELQELQRHLRLMQAFLDDVSAVLTADKPKAEKVDALRQLHPRAEELGKGFAAVGMKNLRRAAQTLGTAEEWEQRTAALEAADKDPQLAAALAEVGDLIEGKSSAAQLETARKLADDTIGFVGGICELIVSDSSAADKIAALQAMKPRAAELRELMLQVGPERFATAVKASATAEDEQRLAAVGEVLKKAPEVKAAAWELIRVLTIVRAEEPAPQSKLEAHELLADDIISFMRGICDVLESDKPQAEKIAALEALQEQADELHRYMKSMGRQMVLSTVQERTTPEDKQRMDALRERLKTEPELEAARKALDERLLNGPKVQYSPEVMQAAKNLLELMQEMDALMLADTSEADRLAAMQALRPRVLEMGKQAQGIAFSKIARAAEAIMREQGTEPDFPGLDAACDNPEIERLLGEYRDIMMNVPAPLAEDTPAVQVAAEFLTIVADTLDRIRDPKLDEMDKVCAMEDATYRLMTINEWAMASGRGPEVYALLEANPRFRELVQQYRSVGGLTHGNGEAAKAASSYLMILDVVTENLRHADVAP